MEKLLIAFLFLSVIFETVFFSFPFVLFFSIMLYLYNYSRTNIIFIFIAGFLLGSLRADYFAANSIFILATIIVISVYQSAFEVKSLKFTLIFSFISLIIYANLFSYHLNILLYSGFFLIVYLLYFYLGGSVIFSNPKTHYG